MVQTLSHFTQVDLVCNFQNECSLNFPFIINVIHDRLSDLLRFHYFK